MMTYERARRTARDGFALLTVLWVLSGMIVLGALLNRTAGEAIGAASNRSDALRAEWANEGCLARARAAMDSSLRDATDAERQWGALDGWLPRELASEGCHVDLLPVGTTLDVNVASHERLLLLLLAAGMRYEHADSIAAAIIDWRDEDDEPQRGGAEKVWYRANSRSAPRNGPLAAREELWLVRGLEHADIVALSLDVEPGRVLLTRAPAVVLATLPGFGQEAVAQLLAMRETGSVDIQQIAALLSPEARAELQAHALELASLASVTPDAWITTSRTRRSTTGGTASIELRLVRSGRRAAVVRRRSSPWS